MSDAVGNTVVTVELGLRSYDIIIGAGLIESAGAYIQTVTPGHRAIIVTDEHVAPFWLEKLKNSLIAEEFEVLTKIVSPGEKTKSMTQIHKLTDWMLDRGVDRKTTVVALGGGVIGDLAGFAAAITLRGLPFVQIPTTLLAQVDSSVGGKTAVDTRHGKNMLGAFHQPHLVLADTNTLTTLPKRQLLAGYAEVVKYGLINNLIFFEWCEINGQALLAGNSEATRQAIEMSCRAKAAIVAQDEYENSDRALLNLGHTFGHAFEANVGFSNLLLHGEAVAVGILSAFDLSFRLGYCTGQDVTRVRQHFLDVGLPTNLNFIPQHKWEAEMIMGHMKKDKKWKNGKQTFILTNGIGKSFIHPNIDANTLLCFLSDLLTTLD